MRWRQLEAALRHPASLWAALAMGSLAGALAPLEVRPAWLPWAGSAYIALLNLVAVPLVWVGLLLNMARMRMAPRAAYRLGVLACAWGVGLAACAVIGLVVASGAGVVPGLDDRDAVGRLALAHEPALEVPVDPRDDPGQAADGGSTAPGQRPEAGGAPVISANVVPDPAAMLRSWADLGLPMALAAAVVLGCALGRIPGASAGAAEGTALGVQQALAVLLDTLQTLLPLYAFALAATLAAAAWDRWALVMAGFAVPFICACAFIALLALGMIAWCTGRSPVKVLLALRESMALALWPAASLAPVPAMVRGLAGRLGLRRDLVELAVPLAPAVARAGDVVFCCCLAVFAARLHGRLLGGEDLVLVALGAVVGSLGAWGGALAAAAMVLSLLELPMAPLLPAFALLEVLCAGARQLVSLLVVGALVALISPRRRAPAGRARPNAPTT